jgi:DNA-binding XRE family transcriptional regulator
MRIAKQRFAHYDCAMPRTKPIKSVVEILRRELGLQQGEFAERVGLSRRTIQEIEYGGPLSWKSARAISMEFNVRPDWLMKNDPDQPMTTISGAHWSPKHRKNLRDIKNQSAMAKAAAWVITDKVIRPLLEDYLKFRSYFTFAVFTHPEEIEHWREIQRKAWEEFQDDNPFVAEWAKETLPGDILNRANLESIKEDIEAAIHMPPLPEKAIAKKSGRKK